MIILKEHRAVNLQQTVSYDHKKRKAVPDQTDGVTDTQRGDYYTFA